MLVIQVCVGSACHLKGSYDVISNLQEMIIEHDLNDNVDIKAAFCLGNCASAVSVKFEDEDEIFSVKSKETRDFFNSQVLKRI